MPAGGVFAIRPVRTALWRAYRRTRSHQAEISSAEKKLSGGSRACGTGGSPSFTRTDLFCGSALPGSELTIPVRSDADRFTWSERRVPRHGRCDSVFGVPFCFLSSVGSPLPEAKPRVPSVPACRPFYSPHCFSGTEYGSHVFILDHSCCCEPHGNASPGSPGPVAAWAVMARIVCGRTPEHPPRSERADGRGCSSRRSCPGNGDSGVPAACVGHSRYPTTERERFSGRGDVRATDLCTDDCAG